MISAKLYFVSIVLVIAFSACNQNGKVETITGEEETEMNGQSERGDTAIDVDQGGSTGIETGGEDNGARYDPE